MSDVGNHSAAQITGRKRAAVSELHNSGTPAAVFFPLEAIFYAGPLSDCIGATFTLIMYFVVLKKRLVRVMERRSAE